VAHPLAPLTGYDNLHPLLKRRRGMRGGSQINKIFQIKLNLLDNYNFVVGEPLRHCVPPPLPLSQGEEFRKVGLLLPEQRQAKPCPTINAKQRLPVGQRLLSVFLPQGEQRTGCHCRGKDRLNPVLPASVEFGKVRDG